MAAVENQNQHQGEQPWFLKASHPVLFPFHEALTKSRADFGDFVAGELRRRQRSAPKDEPGSPVATRALTDISSDTENYTLVSTATEEEVKQSLAAMDLETTDPGPSSASPFMQGLLNHSRNPAPVDMENKMLTENGDVAHRSTQNALVDLFFELEDVVSGPRLRELLEAGWAEDPLSTLKIIFNARSIHLGKSSKHTFYRAAGWLADNHPLSLVANLEWLSRPVIEKKVKKEGEDDFVLVEPEPNEDDPSRYDVKHGVAHGYWKDLLNILALAVNKKLTVLADPKDVLNVEDTAIKTTAQIRRMKDRDTGRASLDTMRRNVSLASASRRGNRRSTLIRGHEARHALEERTVRIGNPKTARRQMRNNRHQVAVSMFNNNPIYRALHLTIARLFVEQLQADLAALRGSDPSAKKNISLCAKWAPSDSRFHERHTFIISSIAEVMYPRESFDNVLSATDSRSVYLRYAREQYRKDVSALRKHLEIVERDITTNKFENIKYDRVPSIAMHNYSKLFIQKDMDRFEKYIDRVAEGKSQISGATLLPSTLVHAVESLNTTTLTSEQMQSMTPEAIVKYKTMAIQSKVVDNQWKTLVQRIKDSGALSSSLAVCDVSGSMYSPVFKDNTCPLDTSIGLSLLVAEVTEPPFGGAFIAFHTRPEVVKVDLSKSFTEKVQEIKKAPWDTSTNFVSVFEDLILPMAIRNNLKQEDMVKRVFVFSDMQFNHASDSSSPWSSSYERIKKLYADAGYEMPELVFWNLAGGRAGYDKDVTVMSGDPTAPKPVTATEVGTALVGGYSQGMLKVFMDNGSFEDPDEDESNDGDREGRGETTESDPKPKKKDPMAVVKKAISHKAYNMLQVRD